MLTTVDWQVVGGERRGREILLALVKRYSAYITCPLPLDTLLGVGLHLPSPYHWAVQGYASCDKESWARVWVEHSGTRHSWWLGLKPGLPHQML